MKLEDICELIKLKYEIAEEGLKQGIFSELWVMTNIFGIPEDEAREHLSKNKTD